MSQMPTEKQRKESENFAKRFSLDFDILGGSADPIESSMDAFFNPPKRKRLKTKSKGLDLIRKKKRAFDKAYQNRKMIPVPCEALPSKIDFASFAKNQMMGAKEGTYVTVKTKLARNKKTRIY